MKIKLLITSVANKVPLIECIKATTTYDLQIIGADSNESNIAKFFCDSFWKMPLLKDLDIDILINFCQENKINYILPTREADLEYFALNLKKLKLFGIHVLTSNYTALKKTNDKYLFYKALTDANINVIPTYRSIDCHYDSYVVKDRYGTGSKQIFINVTKEQATEAVQLLEFPIVQPYIKGQEYSIDVYISKDRKMIQSVVRKRNLVIDGESQITEIIDYLKLNKLIQKASLVLKLEGHVMFQAIEDEFGELWIIECNARIGGASTLCIYAGLDTFNWWIKESFGEKIELPVDIKKLKQIRYKKDLII